MKNKNIYQVDKPKKWLPFDKVMTLVTIIGLLLVLSIVFTSCGTSRVGGCGGSPIHLGN